jgi:hypothetical protein
MKKAAEREEVVASIALQEGGEHRRWNWKGTCTDVYGLWFGLASALAADSNSLREQLEQLW